jgi:hypothetical protein
MRFRMAVPATLLVLLLASHGAQAAMADTFVGGTADWSFVGTPRVTAFGVGPSASTTFHNNLDVTVIGIVLMVVHNNLGQTVFYSTATLNLTRGFSGTAYTVEFGLTPGVYKATIFAFSPSGVAISNSTTFSFGV